MSCPRPPKILLALQLGTPSTAPRPPLHPNAAPSMHLFPLHPRPTSPCPPRGARPGSTVMGVPVRAAPFAARPHLRWRPLPEPPWAGVGADAGVGAGAGPVLGGPGDSPQPARSCPPRRGRGHRGRGHRDGRSRGAGGAGGDKRGRGGDWEEPGDTRRPGWGCWS